MAFQQNQQAVQWGSGERINVVSTGDGSVRLDLDGVMIDGEVRAFSIFGSVPDAQRTIGCLAVISESAVTSA